MEIDFDDILFGREILSAIQESGTDTLVAQLKATSAVAQERIGQLQMIQEPPKASDFTNEKNSLLQLMQSLPAGHLSDFCQKLWQETERKIQRIEEQASETVETIQGQKQQAVLSLKRQVGQAVLVAEQCPDATGSALTSVNPIKAIQGIYSTTITTIVNRVKSFGTYQMSAGIEDAQLAVSIRMAREIAGALLTAQGQLNLAIIPDLQAAFLPNNRPLLNYEKHIGKILSRIDSSWQFLLDTVVKPTSDASNAALAIRADLNLSPKLVLQDIHAKQAVLTALLSQHNQGPAGNCFAVAFAINLQDEFIKTALSRYQELVQWGSLGRTVNGRPDRFFFVNTCANSDLQSPITVDMAGKLSSGPFLWEAPSFKFAFQQMDIANAASVAPAALQILGATNGSVQTTPQAVLEAFATAASSSSLQAGIYAFSTVDNRVLRAFETALAAMSEARSSDYVRSSLLQSVDAPLQFTYRTLAAQYQAGLVTLFRNIFLQTLNDRIRYVYDAAIQYSNSSLDQVSTSGAFTLYDRHLTNSYHPGTRIATPDQFQGLLLDAVAQTARGFNDPTMWALADAVKAAVQESGFMKRVLLAYEPNNAIIFDPVAGYASLSRTPMTSQDGGNPVAVAEIDTGLSFSSNVQTAYLADATDLLNWVLSLVSWKQSTQHYLDAAYVDQLDPATSPQHAFNLAVGVSEIVDFLRSSLSIQDWTQQRLYVPGNTVANWQIDALTKNNYISEIVTQLNVNLSWAVAPFYKAVNALSTRAMTVSQFASSVVQVLTGILRGAEPDQIALICDALLFRALPEAQLSTLEHSAVRVALTNWTDSDKDVYFCVYLNPRTKSLALGTINEDFQSLRPMDEAQWLNADWTADVANELSTVEQ